MSLAFPSLKAEQMLRLLRRELGYTEEPGRKAGGSHRRLISSEGHPPITWAFHVSRSLAPSEVKKVLVNQVGLTLAEAKEVVGSG